MICVERPSDSEARPIHVLAVEVDQDEVRHLAKVGVIGVGSE